MADRHDPIVDDTPNKRRKLNNESSGHAWDSQEDSGDDFTENDFETAATLPLAQSQKRKLPGYTPSQLHSDLNTGTHGRASQSDRYITQPTQTLPVTQPTQPLPEVQVERSSPIAPGASSQRPMPAPMTRAPFSKPGGVLASAMAPPGTSFRRPPGVQSRPAVIDVDSDDDAPSQRSDDEETQGLSSNIKPTNFKRAGRGLDSSPNRVKESPRAAPSVKSGDAYQTPFMSIMSQFGYQPQTRPIDDMASSYGSTSRGPRPQQPMRQNDPSRAIMNSSPPLYQTLDDVPDYELRRKITEIRNVYPHYHIPKCMEALTRRKGNVQDAMEWLADQEKAEEPDELSLSPVQRKGVAKGVAKPIASQSSFPSQPPRIAAKQQVKAPAKTIAEKYGRGAAKDREEGSDDEDDIKPRKGRLVQGRKPRASSSSPPASSPPPQNRPRLATRKPIIIDDDSEPDSGVGRDESEEVEIVEKQRPSARAPQENVQDMRNKRLLKIINDSSAKDLAELCGQPEETIQFVLDKKPFASLDEVSDVTMETLTKTGKKSKKTRRVGEKLVDDCTEMMTGYDAIDELVVECEQLARPVQEALKGWGVGKGDGGELQLMDLDEAHDSGIGTPASSCAPDDPPGVQNGKKTKPKGNFIGQPPNMSADITMKNYQLVGLNWLYLLFKKNLSCILADDMVCLVCACY